MDWGWICHGLSMTCENAWITSLTHVYFQKHLLWQYTQTKCDTFIQEALVAGQIFSGERSEHSHVLCRTNVSYECTTHLRLKVNTRCCAGCRCAHVCASASHLSGHLAPFKHFPLCVCPHPPPPLPSPQKRESQLRYLRNSFQSSIMPYWKFIRKIP